MSESLSCSGKDAGVHRRQLFRHARRVIAHRARRHWRGSAHDLERQIRAHLRNKDRGFLERILRYRSFAAAIALLVVTGAPLHTRAIDLSDIVAGDGGFLIHGANTYDGVGFAISGAGDVNGDNLDDIIVGQPGYATFAGRSHVIFGKSTTTPISIVDTASGVGGFVINGINEYDQSSRSVAGAGDVNGDNLDDVIIGAQFASPDGKKFAGESYVVFGKATTSAVDLADVASGTGGFLIKGVAAFDSSGFVVAGAGDVNGDNFDDIIIGAPYADPGGLNYAGASYVVFGKATTTTVELSDVVNGIGGFVITGSAIGDQSGKSVSGAGDVNGDGLDDVIVGAPEAEPSGNWGEGESYVVFGKASTAAVNLTDVAAGSGGFVIVGIDASDHAGSAVSGAGDVNGDELDDLIVGAHDADLVGEYDIGESYVVFGKASTSAVNLSDVATGTGGFLISGVSGGDEAGNSVDGAGDFDGDGLDDLVIGAYLADPNGNSNAGKAYVVRGSATTPGVRLSDVEAGVGGFALLGIDSDDAAGRRVSGAGDVNGDGLDDVLVSAPYADPGGNASAGELYVIFSPAPLPLPTAVWVDFAHTGAEVGAFFEPFNTLQEGLGGVTNGGTIQIKGDSSDSDTGATPRITKPVTLQAVGGPVIIGRDSG